MGPDRASMNQQGDVVSREPRNTTSRSDCCLTSADSLPPNDPFNTFTEPSAFKLNEELEIGSDGVQLLVERKG